MNILLLEHPRSVCQERCNDIANTPLSSCLNSGYAAVVLSTKGHRVEIIEGFLQDLTYQEIEQRITEFKPDLLAVHMVYHWQDDLPLFSFLEKVKQAGLSRYITAFGFYPTIAYEDILAKCPGVDSVIVGEHELTIADLAESVSEAKSVPRLLGLAVRDDEGGVTCTRRELISDLDLLPFPTRTQAMFRIQEVNLLGSRGCYGGCTFCYINPFYGQSSHWRGRSPENIVAEIDNIIAEHGAKEFYFTDPNFFGPGQKGHERALKLASLLKSRNIRFGIEARVNDIHPETLGPLVEAGLHHLLIGLESGRDSSLRRLNKMTTVEQNERAIRLLREYEIEPNVGFIMFEPDSSLEDVRVNYEFLRRNQLLNNLPVTANLLYHHQIVLKGTPAYRHLLQEGRLKIQSSGYEATTAISNPQVELLAGIMRQITNYLFEQMAGIWGGKVPEPTGAPDRYAKVNCLLVQTFELSLGALESGEEFDEERVELLVTKVKKKIVETLGLEKRKPNSPIKQKTTDLC